MKFAHRTAFLCLTALPLALACGSNDTSGLFETGGTASLGTGGSLASGGNTGSSGHAGQGVGGTATNSAGTSGGSSVAGQGTSGGDTGGSGFAGSNTGGMSTGGDGATNGGATNGGTANGGAANGGTGGDGAGAGGSPSAGAGVGGTSAGVGGMSGGGVGGANGGSGGSGGVSCPTDKPPQVGDVCTASKNCFYPGEECSCLSDGQTAGRHWACYVGTPDKCPGTGDVHPTDGASCAGLGGARCPYAMDDFCVCVPSLGGGGNDPKWQCNPKNPNCPDLKPGNTFCGTDIRECIYADRACFCAGVTWSCE